MPRSGCRLAGVPTALLLSAVKAQAASAPITDNNFGASLLEAAGILNNSPGTNILFQRSLSSQYIMSGTVGGLAIPTTPPVEMFMEPLF